MWTIVGEKAPYEVVKNWADFPKMVIPRLSTLCQGGVVSKMQEVGYLRTCLVISCQQWMAGAGVVFDSSRAWWQEAALYP